MSTTYQFSRRTFYVGDPDRNYGVVWPNAIDADEPDRVGFLFPGDPDHTDLVFESSGGTPYVVTDLPFKVHTTDFDRWYWRGFVIPDSVPQGTGYVLKLNGRTLANNLVVSTPPSYNAWQTIALGSNAATINAALASGQPTANRIRFEPGTYEIDAPLFPYSNTLIDGGGAILRPAPGYTSTTALFGLNNVSRVTLRNFVFQDWNVNGESRRLIDHSGSGYGPHLVVKKCRFEATQLGIFDQTSDVGLLVRDNIFHRSSAGIAATGFYVENSFIGHPEYGQEFTVSNASNLAVMLTSFDRARRGFTLSNTVTKNLFAWFWMTQGGAEPNAGEFINFEGSGSETLESTFIGGRTTNWPGNLTLFDQTVTRCMFADFDLDRAGVEVWGLSAQTGNVFQHFQMRGGGFRFNISTPKLAADNTIQYSALLDWQYDRLNQFSYDDDYYTGRDAVIQDGEGVSANNISVSNIVKRQSAGVLGYSGVLFSSASGGAHVITLTVVDADTQDPLPLVVATTDDATGETDADGVAAFLLADGSYEFTLSLPGYTTREVTVTLTENSEETIELTRIDDMPATVTGTLICYDEEGVELPDCEVHAEVFNPGATTGLALDSDRHTATSDINGVVNITGLFKGVFYKLKRSTSRRGYVYQIPTDATSPHTLPSIVGP